jgi:hypothetical protein
MVDINIDEGLLNRLIDRLESAGNDVIAEGGSELRQTVDFADDAIEARITQAVGETDTALTARITQAVGETDTALTARITQAVNETNTALADRITQTNNSLQDRIDQVRTNVVEPTIARLDTFVDDLKRKLVRGAILVLDLIVLGVLVFFLWALPPVSTTQLVIAIIVLAVFFVASAILLLSDRAINYLLGLGP